MNAGAVSAGEGTDGNGNGSLADQLVNSALRYRGQAPIVDSLLSEIGLNGADINGLTGNVQSDSSIPAKTTPKN